MGQSNYMSGYPNQNSGQQGMLDNSGNQMMSSNTGPGNPTGSLQGSQFNAPLQQYQNSGSNMMRSQPGFVSQGNASQAGMQPRVPMTQVSRLASELVWHSFRYPKFFSPFFQDHMVF